MRKVDNNVKKILISNLELWKKELIKEIDYHLDSIKKAESSEKIMYLKRNLLLKLLHLLPISRNTCYICIAKTLKSSHSSINCPYTNFLTSVIISLLATLNLYTTSS